MIWVWLSLRLLPAPSIAAVENRIDFGAAWAMTKGNFWRMIGAGILFIFIYQAVVSVFFLVALIPGAMIFGLIFAAGAALGDIIAMLGLFVMALVGAGLLIAIVAFGMAAEIAFPARIYAHLAGKDPTA